MRVRCSEASEQWGRSDLGEIVLGDLGDGVEYRDILWEMYSRALRDGSNSQLSSKCRSSRRVCGWGDLQPNPSNASRRRQSCALFGYDSCARYTALLKLMPDDARRQARLQGPKTRGQRIHAYSVG